MAKNELKHKHLKQKFGRQTEDLEPLKARCLKPPGHYLCTPGPGRPDCIISIEKGVNGYTYPVAISQKVKKNLPVSFYSPTPGFKLDSS